jgi:polar amino acid transport system permease protein
MNDVWSWEVFFDNLVNPAVLEGLWTTIWLTFVTLFGAMLVGAVAATLAQSDNKVLQWIYTAYTTIFRGTPLLVQLVFLYSALPQLGINLTVLQAAIVGLVLAESPYMAEIIRSSLLGITRGQKEASQMVGMSPLQTLLVILLPQAARTAVPPIGNEFVRQLKNTSLVSVISMSELFRVTNDLMQTSFRVLEALAVATFYYVVIFAVWTWLQKRIERKLAVSTARPVLVKL